jgi:hypothetical protein
MASAALTLPDATTRTLHGLWGTFPRGDEVVGVDLEGIGFAPIHKCKTGC